MLSGDTLTWDQSLAAAAAGNGQVSWDTHTVEWTNQNNQQVAWSNSSPSGIETAVFPGNGSLLSQNGGLSVNLAATMNVAAITFDSSGYALSNGVIQFPSAGGAINGPTATQNPGWDEIDSPITGGPLTTAGNGIVILTGSNSYTGGTTISSGTLQVGVTGSSSTLSTGPVNLSSGSTLAFDLGTPLTFSNNIVLSAGSQSINILGRPATLSGVISGNGPVIIGDPGGGTLGSDNAPDLMLGGCNTYTGSTTITPGTDLSVPGSVASSSIIIDPGASLATQPTSFDSPTTLDDNGSFDYDDPTPDIDPPETPITLSGFGSLTVTGGVLNIIGTNTFNGQTTVSYGTLSLQTLDDDGTAASSVTVAAGSTLDGTGGTQGIVEVQNGGALTPGTANGIGIPVPGSLSTGNVTLDTGSTFYATVNGAIAGTDYDQLTVNGSLTIGNDSTLIVSGSLNVVPMTTITLIHTVPTATAANGISGYFANLPDGSQVAVGDDICTVSYTPTGDLDLTVTQTLPSVSVIQQDATIYVGQPTNFTLQAIGPAGAEITTWNLNFGDNSPPEVISSAPSVASGGIYQWYVQHTFSTTGILTMRAAAPLHPFGLIASYNPDVLAAVSAPITLGAATPESSTQVNVAWEYTGAFDSFEIAAADTSVTPLDYSVVAAGIGNGYEGSALVSGLKPNKNYDFLVYGVTPSGSVCSVMPATATTPALPSLSAAYVVGSTTSIYSYTATDDLLDSSGQPADISYAWKGFDDNGSPVAFTNGNSSATTIITNSQELGSITVVATLVGAPAGAFDSLTYYNIKPAIVVTGTSGPDLFDVSVDSNGLYTITGSVTVIPPFYAPNGIDLEVHGRGGVDTLQAGSGTDITLTTDPQADGTTLIIDGGVNNGYLHPGQPPTPPPAGLLLPGSTTGSFGTVPTTGDTFTPPVQSNLGGPNEITQATATAEPGDVIALTAEGLIIPQNTPTGPDEPISTAFWVYGQTTSGNADWAQATIVSVAAAGTNPADSNALAAVSIQLPQSLPAHSIYLLYEVNTVGSSVIYSQPYVINQPQIWWTDQNNSYAGGKVSVFGTNLSYGVSLQPYSDQSWVYLFPCGADGSLISGVAPIMLPETAVAPSTIDGSGAMDVNAYKVDFNLPSSVTAGYYQVEIYNGHGGASGLSGASLINVKLALSSTAQNPPFSLAAAFGYWGPRGTTPLYLDAPDDTMINPAALNDAIDWANYDATQVAGGPYSYVAIQMPPGEVDVTDASDIIQMQPFVHLLGAGDTGDPATGTVIDAVADAGVEGVIQLPSTYGVNASPWGMAITNMSINGTDANGGIKLSYIATSPTTGYFDGGVIFDESQVTGLTIQGVTIDATSDDPANEKPVNTQVEDVGFSSYSSNLQFLDSTFIGAGIAVSSTESAVDNCHFIGCSAAGAQIVDSAPASNLSNFSVTRCTDQSLVDNITSPGGNVEYDAACRLFEVGGVRADLYLGSNTAADMYAVPEISSGTNGGEIISIEADTNFGPNKNMAVFQNTLAGDGAEALLDNSSGVTVAGDNVVIADNDISNVAQGIHLYNNGLVTQISFGIYTNNSIHNVDQGIWLQLYSGVSNAPLFFGNVFSDNSINGIISSVNGESKVGGYAGSAAAILITYGPENTATPQDLMNIFSGNTITGASLGLVLDNANHINPVPLGVTVLFNNLLESDGSATSTEIDNIFNDNSVIEQDDDTWQNFWS